MTKESLSPLFFFSTDENNHFILPGPVPLFSAVLLSIAFILTLGPSWVAGAPNFVTRLLALKFKLALPSQ